MNDGSTTTCTGTLESRGLRLGSPVLSKWLSVETLVICYSLLLKMAIDIVDLPIKVVFFHSCVNVYQRVNLGNVVMT